MARINNTDRYPVTSPTRNTLFTGSVEASTGATINVSGEGLSEFIRSELQVNAINANYTYKASNPTNDNGVFLYTAPVSPATTGTLVISKIDSGGTDNTELLTTLGNARDIVYISLRRDNNRFSYFEIESFTTQSTTITYVVTPVTNLTGTFTVDISYQLGVDVVGETQAQATPNLQQVLNTGFMANNRPIILGGAGASYLVSNAQNQSGSLQPDVMRMQDAVANRWMDVTGTSIVNRIPPDGFTSTLTFNAPTANRTITLRDMSGTVAYTDEVITDAQRETATMLELATRSQIIVGFDGQTSFPTIPADRNFVALTNYNDGTNSGNFFLVRNSDAGMFAEVIKNFSRVHLFREISNNSREVILTSQTSFLNAGFTTLTIESAFSGWLPTTGDLTARMVAIPSDVAAASATTPNLTQVLTQGNTANSAMTLNGASATMTISNGTDSSIIFPSTFDARSSGLRTTYMPSGMRIRNPLNSNFIQVQALAAPTGQYTQSLPQKSGTFAMLDDITPITGATIQHTRTQIANNQIIGLSTPIPITLTPTGGRVILPHSIILVYNHDTTSFNQGSLSIQAGTGVNNPITTAINIADLSVSGNRFLKFTVADTDIPADTPLSLNITTPPVSGGGNMVVLCDYSVRQINPD